MRLPWIILTLLALAACTERREQTVWENYDVRHPVPAGSAVPDGYARQFDPYRDNDSYYSPPGCAAGTFDGPSCMGVE
jgi:hypothetical protein